MSQQENGEGTRIEVKGTKMIGLRERRLRTGGVAAVLGVAVAVALSLGRGPDRQPAKKVEPVAARAVAPVQAPAPEPPAPVVPRDHFAEGERYLSQGRVDEAEHAFVEAVKDPALTKEALRTIANRSAGEAGRAALAALAQREPGDAGPLNELALRQFEAGELDAAIASADAAIKRDPRGYEAHQTKGRALLSKGRTAAAIRSFRTAVKDPDAPGSTWNQLGYTLLVTGNPTEALEALDAGIFRGPVSHYMMNNLGLAYEKLGRLDDAEIAYLGALEMKSDYVKAAVNLQRVVDTREEMAMQEAPFDPSEPELVPGG